MTGVILFRAQPFHKGHLNMVQKAFEDSRANDAELYIFVGSADKSGTVRNPIPIEFRLMLIEGAIHEVFSADEMKHIHIYPLEDLDDESNNSYDWGRYLYMKMFSRTRDSDMTIYYSDNPQIMLNWFSADERWCLRFKFLDRYQNISATAVRALLEATGTPDVALEAVLPPFVMIYKNEIVNYIKSAK